MNYIILTFLIGSILSASRVSVHDPSIIQANGVYYVFGSHIAVGMSNDLINWTPISRDYENPTKNTVYGDLRTTFKESFRWAGYNDGDCSGGGYAVWAPDVFFNPDYVWKDGSRGAYMLYYSASSTWRRSCIGLLVSKRINGGYEYVDTILYSGFTNTGKVNYDGNSKRDTTWSNDYLHLKNLMNQGIIDNNLSTWKCFNSDGSWNNRYAPNAIDPAIFYNSVGRQLFMTYGSWSGGIFILELDIHTGKPKYPGKDGKDSTSGNFVDRYFGTHIAGGNHQSGEGPYIKFDKFSGYYFMYETYGGLLANGGYNMRLFRAKTLQGPYYDAAGNKAQDSGANNYKFGVKLIGNYQFKNQVGYLSAGHNSVLITDDGKHFLIFHQRFTNSGEYHEVRVRQQFLNEDKWPVTAVYEYKNENIAKYKAEQVIGSYEFINHGNAEKDGAMIKVRTINLEKGGAVSGDEKGTWSMNDGNDYTYVTLTLSGVIYKGVFFRQKNDNNQNKMTFTAIGRNNMAIWGSSNF